MYKRRDNPFPGINPYLNADLLATGWQSFHAYHIIHIASQLQARLASLGYIVQPETGLQIRKVDPDTGDHTLKTRRPDVVVFPPDLPPVAQAASTTRAAAGVVSTPIPELVIEPEPPDAFTAVKVYRTGDKQRRAPVTWLELLSPSNKPPNKDHSWYASGRYDVLKAGIVFVELDYIHTQPPTVASLPAYSRGEEDALPYHIIVFDPRPSRWEGMAHRYSLGVLAPIPTVTIPLSGEDSVDFDFGAAYRKTYEEALYGEFLDYDAPRTDVTSYRASDQPQIRDWLAAARAEETPT